MKIELIMDQNCFSTGFLTQLKDRLRAEIPGCQVGVIPFASDRERLKKLGVTILPAWVINNELARVDPLDYRSVLRAARKAGTD
jgi:hypothetical protein